MTWQEKPRQLKVLKNVSEWHPSDLLMSASAFFDRFPVRTHDCTTICDPFIHHWFAKLPNGDELILSVSDAEINPQDYKDR